MTVSATFFEIKSLAANWTFSLEFNLLGGPVVSSRLFSTQYTPLLSLSLLFFSLKKKNAALESSMPGELRKGYKRPLDHINTVATLGSNFVLIFSICTSPIIHVGPPPPPKFYTILSERPITFAHHGFRDILEPAKITRLEIQTNSLEN